MQAALSNSVAGRGPWEWSPAPGGQVRAWRRLDGGQGAFFQGQASCRLYAVRRGSFKTTILHADGREQVSRFFYPGDLMGLDAIGSGVHRSTAVALETSFVSTFSLQSLASDSMSGEPWQEVLFRLMSREIAREQSHALLLGSAGSLARLASFLIEASDRMGSQGLSAVDLQLHMSRADIGSYLGLRLETVSRILSALQQNGVLTVDGKHVQIHSLEHLQVLRDRICA